MFLCCALYGPGLSVENICMQTDCLRSAKVLCVYLVPQVRACTPATTIQLYTYDFFSLLRCTHAIVCHARLELIPVRDPNRQVCTEEELIAAGGMDKRDDALQLLNQEYERIKKEIRREESRVLVTISVSRGFHVLKHGSICGACH